MGARLLPGLPERACHLRHCLPGSPGQLGLRELSDPKVNVPSEATCTPRITFVPVLHRLSML